MRVRDLKTGERDLTFSEIQALGREMFGPLVSIYIATQEHVLGKFVVAVFHPDDMPVEGRAPRTQHERRMMESCYRRSKEYGRGFSWHEAFRRAEIMKEAEDSIRKAGGFAGNYGRPRSKGFEWKS